MKKTLAEQLAEIELMTPEEIAEVAELRVFHLAAIIALVFGGKTPEVSEVNALANTIIDIEVDEESILQAMALIEKEDWKPETELSLEQALVKWMHSEDIDKKPKIDNAFKSLFPGISASERDKAWSTYTLENSASQEQTGDTKNDAKTQKEDTPEEAKTEVKEKTNVIEKDDAVLMISTRLERRIRAGRTFGKDPIPVEVADLEEGQLEQLQNDPELIIKFSELADS